MTMRLQTSSTNERTPKVPADSAGFLGEAQFCFPTTRAQQALWYLDRLEPGDSAWNIAVRFRLTGPLDVFALERSINEVVRRHEMLRTTFSEAALASEPVAAVAAWQAPASLLELNSPEPVSLVPVLRVSKRAWSCCKSPSRPCLPHDPRAPQGPWRKP